MEKKEYQKKYRQEHKAERVAWLKKYNFKNKEKIKIKMKNYREGHKKERKEYLEKNKEREITYRNNYYKEHQKELQIKGKNHYKENKDKYKEKHLERKYKMTLSQYNDLLDKQKGLCEICLKPEISKHSNGTTKNLRVDHNHKTGKVRGLLCGNCNTGLGMFRDDTELIDRVKRYLIKYNDITT